MTVSPAQHLLLLIAAAGPAFAAPVPKAPVPASPFIAVVYRYADAMLERGRDTYGPQPTKLFLSALDRAALAPLTNRPPAPAGIREGDRVGPQGSPLAGANPQHDENLLRLLYTMSGLSGKAHYRDAADAELKWFLENARSPATDLPAWGEHLSWNVLTDEPQPKDPGAVHEFFRPWLLWERGFELAPLASRRVAMALWDHQVADHQSGAFDRHARFWQPGASTGMDFPRHAGFFLRSWAVAYDRTRDDVFLKAIETLLGRFEQKRHPRTGLIPSYVGQTNAWPASTLSLAIDCEAAAQHVPEPIRSRLRTFAAREDEVFCALPHKPGARGGFVTSLDLAGGAPGADGTSLWDARYGAYTTAQVAMMCVSRYDNTGRVGYRRLILAAADAYLDSLPASDADVWPMTLGHAICLELAAWRHSARPQYLDRARALGNWAVEKFWQDNPLPRASLKSQHYEAITGGDTLALALVELHLQILHITAVRCPVGTLDR